jgi:hypothetical protein
VKLCSINKILMSGNSEAEATTTSPDPLDAVYLLDRIIKFPTIFPSRDYLEQLSSVEALENFSKTQNFPRSQQFLRRLAVTTRLAILHKPWYEEIPPSAE